MIVYIIFSVIAIAIISLIIIANHFVNKLLVKTNKKLFERKEIKNEEDEEKKRIKEKRKIWFESSQKDVYTVSSDNLKLHAHLINNDSNVYVIIVHPYEGRGAYMKYFAEKFYNMGFNILVVDLRTHGESEGKIYSLGYLERLDILAWIKFINDNYNNSKIILYGISMGANAETVNLNWAEWTEQLNIPRDTTYYENFSMSDSDAYFAFKLGQLDGYGACDPWGSMAEYENTGKILKRQNTDREIDGHGTCCKVCMNYNFAKAHPKLAERILLAHAMSIEYMYLHPYKAAEIFAENYNVPLEVGLMTLWKKLNEEGRTITWKLNRDYVHNQMKTMRRLGVRDDINSLDIDDYIDLSYFDNCGAKDFDVFIKEEVDPIFPLGMSYEDWRAKAVEVDNIKEEPKA